MAGNDAGLIADRPTTHNAALHQLSLRTLTVSFFLLVLLFAFVVNPARANQVPASSAGAGPVVKTYPASALTMTMAISGNTTIGVADGVLNGYGGVVSTQLSPPIAPTSKGLQILTSAAGCNATVAICSNRGTMTLTFSRAVTNPVLHLSGLGGSRTLGANNANFASRYVITSATGPTTSPTFTLLNGNANFSLISTTTAGATTANGGTTCGTAPVAGCGSVRINGTVTSVTFRIDLVISGNWTSVDAAAQDGVGLTVSVDEDFGDAPTSYESGAVASHIVGSVFLGSSLSADNANVTNPGTLTPSPLANANAASDSDDGVTLPTLSRTISSNIDVAVTGSGGRLQGWIDWADDGNFSAAGDRIANNAIDGGAGDADGVVNGVIRIAVTPPATSATTPTIARFRYSTTAGLGVSGLAADGEVEDYEVTILRTAELAMVKTNSASNVVSGSTTTYTLTVTNNGSDSVTGAVVTDTPGAGLNCPAANAVTITGSGIPAGSFTVANLTGAGITLGTLNVGQSAVLTFTCNVP